MKSRFVILLIVMMMLAACGPQAPEVIVVTATAEPAAATAVPTDTLVPTATATETLVPINTLVPTVTMTATPEPVCNQAELVQQGYAEAPADPGQPIPPGTEFTLILRLRNTGACTWTTDYKIVLVGSSGLGVADEQAFTVPAVPGQTVDLPVAVTAPDENGDYSASWQLQAPDGEVFGYGMTGESAFVLDITVGQANVGYGFNFIANACSAVWDSNRATFLPCNGGDRDTFIGYVHYQESANVEGGERDGKPTINVHPDRGRDGFMSGRFPAYRVGIDDHFVAVIGCMGSSADCKMRFELRYRTGGGDTGTLAGWSEKGDGEVHFVDVDLSALAGQTISFVLYTEHEGGERELSDGFWQEARILRAEQAVELAESLGLPAASGAAVAAPPPRSDTCDLAHLLHPVYADVPVYEGTGVHPGTEFTAGWRLTNVGSCTWNQNYEIVLVQTDGVTASVVQSFEGKAAPGESLDVYFELTAPADPGEYNLIWKLRNPNGGYFGYGPNGSQNLSLNFSVLDLPNGVRFDLTQIHCQAQWHSNKATFLPCNGGTPENMGFVELVGKDFKMETGREANRPVLHVNPDNSPKGHIRGIFPPFVVRDGDKFVATIGCSDGVPTCNLFFQLRIIKPNGEEAPIGDWIEVGDDNVRYVTVSLSQWAGKEIQLVLYTAINGGRNAEADGFWMYPHVEGR